MNKDCLHLNNSFIQRWFWTKSSTAPVSRKHPAFMSKGVLPLDSALYDLGEDQRDFLKQITGIQTDEALKRHVLEVQAKAYNVCQSTGVYRGAVCWCFTFSFSRIPVYDILLLQSAIGVRKLSILLILLSQVSHLTFAVLWSSSLLVQKTGRIALPWPWVLL